MRPWGGSQATHGHNVEGTVVRAHEKVTFFSSAERNLCPLLDLCWPKDLHLQHNSDRLAFLFPSHELCSKKRKKNGLGSA